MPEHQYRQEAEPEVVREAAPEAQTDAWGNAATAEALGLSPEEQESQAIEDVWAWMNEEEDACAPSPLFPLDPAQREAQGLPPSGMPGEECVIPIDEVQELEATSPDIAAQIEAERKAAELGTPMGRSRGGGSDSIRWRTRDPNHPSPAYPVPMSNGAQVTLPTANVAPMR